MHLCEISEDWLDPVDAKPMKPTVEWMRTKFDQFNARFFGAKLPLPTLRIGRLGTHILGLFSFGKKIRVNARTRMPVEYTVQNPDNPYLQTCDLTHFDPIITMNEGVARTEHYLEVTLIHEMVHWYVDWRDCKNGYGFPKQGHGREFKDVCDRIRYESNGDYDITTKSDTSQGQTAYDDNLADARAKAQKRKLEMPCSIVWIKYKNGTEGFVLTYQNSLDNILDKLAEYNGFRHHIESVKYCDDGEWCKFVKNHRKFKLSRKYTGYYDFKKFPEEAEYIRSGAGKFRTIQMLSVR